KAHPENDVHPSWDKAGDDRRDRKQEGPDASNDHVCFEEQIGSPDLRRIVTARRDDRPRPPGKNRDERDDSEASEDDHAEVHPFTTPRESLGHLTTWRFSGGAPRRP